MYLSFFFSFVIFFLGSPARWGFPVAVLGAVWSVAMLSHAFEDAPLVGQEFTPTQALLFTCGMFFPIAAYFYANSEWGMARAVQSREWPVASGIITANAISVKV